MGLNFLIECIYRSGIEHSRFEELRYNNRMKIKITTIFRDSGITFGFGAVISSEETIKEWKFKDIAKAVIKSNSWDAKEAKNILDCDENPEEKGWIWSDMDMYDNEIKHKTAIFSDEHQEVIVIVTQLS